MIAVSTISTMKVERPRARSSAAPTRENSRSTMPMPARRAGTKQRICCLLDRPGGSAHALGQTLENIELEAERAIGGADDLSREIGELGGGEAHLPGQRLAMNELRIGGSRHQLVAVLRGDFDEIA